jgi:predicted Zn-dependent protease
MVYRDYSVRYRLSIFIVLASCLIGVSAVRAYGQLPAGGGDYFDPQKRQLLVQLKRYHLDAAVKDMNDRKLNIAQTEVDFVLHWVPNHVEGLLVNEAIAKAKGFPEQAMGRYVRALELYPNHAITHAQFGAYLLDLGRVDAAIDSLDAAVRLDPTLGIAHSYLATAYRRKGEPDRTASEEAQARKYTGRGGAGR